MAALILPSRRVVQPQGPVGIDWGNPLTRGLISAVVPGVHPLDLASNKFPTTQGTLTTNFRVPGAGAGIAGGGVTRKYDSTNFPLFGAPSVAWFILAENIASGDASVVRLDGALTPLQVAEGVPRSIIWRGGLQAQQYSGFNASAVNVFGGLYVDGGSENAQFANRAAATSIANGGSISSTANPLSFLGTEGNGELATGWIVYLSLLWVNPRFGLAQLRSLHDNPWQLFRPIQRRIWVASGGGGATLLPGLLNNTSVLYAPTVAPGAVSVAPPLLSSVAVLYAPTVAPGAVTLQPGLIDASASPFAPSITVGAVSVTPPLLSAEAVLYAPTVAVAGAALQPPLLSAEATPYAPSVAVGAVTLQPGLLSAEAVLYAPEVTAFAPGAQAVQPPLLSAPAAVFAPSITVGAVTVAPPLLSAEAAALAPTVTTGVTVSAPLLSAEAVLYAPAVTAGEAEVLPPLLASQAILYAPSVSFGQVLSAPLLSADAVLYAPTIFEGALSYDKAYLVAPPARLWRADGSPRNWRTS